MIAPSLSHLPQSCSLTSQPHTHTAFSSNTLLPHFRPHFPSAHHCSTPHQTLHTPAPTLALLRHAVHSLAMLQEAARELGEGSYVLVHGMGMQDTLGT